MPFIHAVFLNCHFSNKWACGPACKYTSFTWKCDRHLAFY